MTHSDTCGRCGNPTIVQTCGHCGKEVHSGGLVDLLLWPVDEAGNYIHGSTEKKMTVCAKPCVKELEDSTNGEFLIDWA